MLLAACFSPTVDNDDGGSGGGSGGSGATGGGTASGGGTTASGGGGTVASGGGTAATGGGTSASGGGTASTGGGGTSASGGGAASTGGGSAATGGGTASTGGGSATGGSGGTGGGSTTPPDAGTTCSELAMSYEQAIEQRQYVHAGLSDRVHVLAGPPRSSVSAPAEQWLVNNRTSDLDAITLEQWNAMRDHAFKHAPPIACQVMTGASCVNGRCVGNNMPPPP